MNILIINGHQPYPSAKGELADTLVGAAKETLEAMDHTVHLTTPKHGYDPNEEFGKFTWADSVIFHVPVFWFNVPGVLKTYLDRVYLYGKFFNGSDDYGRGGLMIGKSFMIVSTWNADERSFTAGQFNDGTSPDNILLPLRKTQLYCGLSELKHIAFLDVLVNPQPQQCVVKLRRHLQTLYAQVPLSF